LNQHEIHHKIFIDEDVEELKDYLAGDVRVVTEEGLKGADDKQIFKRAQELGRLIITANKKDYQQLHYATMNHAGILTFSRKIYDVGGEERDYIIRCIRHLLTTTSPDIVQSCFMQIVAPTQARDEYILRRSYSEIRALPRHPRIFKEDSGDSPREIRRAERYRQDYLNRHKERRQ